MTERNRWIFGRMLGPLSLFGLLLTAGLPEAHAQRDLKDIPEPDPVAEMESMQLDPRVSVNLFASDPQIRKPIQTNFDPLGRLWVASSEAYPQLAPGEVANDKIIVLEDADGDGVAERSTVFADGLLIPTGVLPDGPHAAYVAHATEVLYLEDTDRDGRADRRQVVMSGFGTEDTHHLIHTLRWGPDGCLYFNQSIYIHSTIETAYGVRRLDGGGIWRYRPETGQLEVFCKGFVNPWGHVFDAYGQSLVTDGAYFDGINHAFPDAVFVTSPGAPRWLKGMNPGSPKHCGLAILSGRHVPDEWQGDVVTNDFRSHRVCRFTVQPSGSTFQSRQQPEIVTSSHVAFRPIDAAMGGDGALYIADWYNPIIQHGEVDFRDERRDREHGRIWRISFDDQPLSTPPNYAAMETGELVDLLEDPALTVRQFARLELKQRDTDPVRAETERWVQSAEGASQRDHRQLEAMWIDECLDVVDADRISSVLESSEPRIRAAAVRTVGHRREQLPSAEQWLATAASDSAALVRLEAVAALGRSDSAAAMEAALQVLEFEPLDDHLDFALWNTARQLAPFWTEKLAAGQFDFADQPRRLEFLLSAAGNPAAAEPVVSAVADTSSKLTLTDDQAASLAPALAGVADPAQLKRLLTTVLRSRSWSAGQRADLLRQIVERCQRRGVQPNETDEMIVNGYAAAEQADLRSALISAAAAWKIEAMVPQLERLLTEEVEPSGALATLALEALGQIATSEALATLTGVTQNNSAPATLRASAVVALAGPARDRALDRFAELVQTASTRSAMIERADDIVNRKDMAAALAARIDAIELPPDGARQLLSVVRSVGAPDRLVEAIRRAGRLEDAGWKWSETLRDSVLTMAAEQGDPAVGEAIYRRESLQCIQCHAIGEGGGLVGPNLVSLGGASTAEYILRSLVDPNDKLKEGYSTTQVLTADGRVIQGIAAGGDQETLQLRTAEGEVVAIPKNEIEDESPGKSLMPVGLVDTLTREELAHLTRFLSELGRTPEYTVGTRPVVRAVESLIYTDDANRRMNRTSSDAVATEDPVFQWAPLTSRVDGTIPVAEMNTYQQHREIPPSGYIRFDLTVGDADRPSLHFSEQEGLQMWVNGRPTPTSQAKDLQLDPGTHTIILGINKDVHRDGLVIERGEE